MNKVFPILIFLSIVGACGMPMGDKIESKNLTVYYLDGVPKEKAIRFAKYWKNNGFVKDKPQIIQLEKLEDSSIAVKLIEKEIYHNEELSIHEKSLLQSLERTLEKEVFGEEVTLMITDNTFRPIERE